MKKIPDDAFQKREAKMALGSMIKDIRSLDGTGGMSQRKLAEAVGLSPSNMKYIEDGVNAPSPDVYEAIVDCLKPDVVRRNELDRIYSQVRGTPPPDVCRIVCRNSGLSDVLRIIEEKTLSDCQLDALKELLKSFSAENR